METSTAGAGLASDTSPAGGAGGFVLGGSVYLIAAAVVAAVHASSAITRGWWLVAFLSLVGGLSQLLIGPGLFVLAKRIGAPAPPRHTAGAEFALWNGGTAAVAVADLAPSFTGVLAGGALLGAALLLFAADLRAVRAGAERPAPGWIPAYGSLLGFLALSILLGILLAYLRGR
jgi:hypothetical protein